MHVSKDSMWREIWKILQNFLGTKQGLRSSTLVLAAQATAPSILNYKLFQELEESKHLKFD
jgi:hypothetical protein